MELEELERKLEESLKSLREDNKSMIELLQTRQADFYKTLISTSQEEPSQSLQSDNHRETLPSKYTHENERSNVLRLSSRPSIETEVLGISQPRSSRSARLKLSSQRRENASKDENIVEDTSVKTRIEPRSILKQRQMIDDNIKVDSKYQHDLDLAAPPRTGLNYSYEDLDEEQLLSESVSREMERLRLADLTVPRASDTQANAERYLKHLQAQRQIREDLENCERTHDDRLLVDSGNDRQRASVAKELSRRPKNVLFDLNDPDPESLEETMKRYNPEAGSKLKRYNYKSDLNDSRQGRPLLGYDWIAGVLENEGLWPMTTGTGDNKENLEQTDELFKGISEFRKQNIADCVSTAPMYEHYLDLARPISPQIEDPGHTCIHGFSVNERLFTEAINLDDEGKSVCPVCLVSRKQPTPQEPAFVRVSIPKSTVENAYKIKPKTRKSYEPCDSMALAHHCLAGYKSTKPCTLPTARTLDIKDKIRSKEATTYDEARQVAESFSRMGRLLTNKPGEPPKNRLTRKLLDDTNNTSFRYEMETIRKLSGLDTDTYRLTPMSKA